MLVALHTVPSRNRLPNETKYQLKSYNTLTIYRLVDTLKHVHFRYCLLLGIAKHRYYCDVVVDVIR